MQQVSANYRGYTIFARALGPTGGPWVGAFSVYERGPDNSYPGALEGTLSKKFLSVADAQNAATVKCKRQLDFLLAQALLTQHGRAPVIQRRRESRQPAWERGR